MPIVKFDFELFFQRADVEAAVGLEDLGNQVFRYAVTRKVEEPGPEAGGANLGGNRRRREGAIVTGIDFSAPAIEAARKLADETNIDAAFLVSNVYDLPENLEGEFDIVFTGYGALNWLPDMEAWAKVAAQFVKPGGTFYVVEFHPMSMIFDDDPKLTALRVKYPYFPEFGPIEDDQDGTYVDLEAKFEHKLTYYFPHPVGEVVSALIDAGLRIEFLHEFPFTPWKFLETMKQVDPYSWRLVENDGSVPLIYSIKATKPN